MVNNDYFTWNFSCQINNIKFKIEKQELYNPFKSIKLKKRKFKIFKPCKLL